MLLFPNMRVESSRERAVAAGFTVTQEGSCLAWDNVNGGVKPSAGAATDKFCGVSFSHQYTPLYLPIVESVVIGAGNTSKYSNQFAAGTARVYDVTAGASRTVVAGAPNAGEVKLDNTTLTLTANVADAGHTFLFYYRFSPTTVQMQTRQGDIPAGGGPALILGSVGVVFAGDIFTSEFDTAVDYTVVNPAIVTGANGLFTIGGSGVAIPNVQVLSVPGVDSPWLGLRFSV